LGDAKYSIGLIVIANMWKGLGYLSVLFLAAIAGIDQEQYEAATVDGASRMQKIWHITVPSLYPTLGVQLVLYIGGVFSSSFEQFYMFTTPTNRPTMLVYDMYIYTLGFSQGRISYAIAAGLTQSVVGLCLLLLVNRINKKLSGNSVF
jgi:putative aldouronate transport system permease protein